ncbi:CHRromatin Organization modifier domain-containing protein [Daldinia loculata]|uniref:CHRromatin Organization modifier domain-containing protein n=1 Tax=Daldinia loculata TaxID=103429 RepID=UPI0020C2A5F6|nr:CHRromatin Organization modifier domain-containing protein [Daldinia loculata]KAI1642640.1 CHRromatin Organization modifier domain-containing protein [Daldinia loculata]
MAPSRVQGASTIGKKPHRLPRSSSIDRNVDVVVAQPQRPARPSTVVYLRPVKEETDWDNTDDDDEDDDNNGNHNLEESPCQKSQRKLVKDNTKIKPGSTHEETGPVNQLARKSSRIQGKAVLNVARDGTKPVRKITRKLSVVLGIAPKAKKEYSQGPRRSTRVAAAAAISRIAETSSKKSKATSAKPAVLKPKSEGVSRRGRTSGAKAKAEAAKKEWQVDKIVGTRKNKTRGTEYLVKWAGFSDDENTWEPEGNLDHCRRKVAQFNATLARKK